MNVNRYKARGTTQSSGIGAIFRLMWLVTATSSVDAHAAKAIHNRSWPPVGRAALEVSATLEDSTALGAGSSAARASFDFTRLTHAAKTHSAANRTYPELHK